MQRGYTFLTIIFVLFLVNLSLMVAIPVWETQIKRNLEKEAIFRGTRIVEAIGRYIKKHPGKLPKNLDELVKEKLLRRKWRDPLSKGNWYLVMLPQVPNPDFVYLVKEEEAGEFPRPALIGVAPRATGEAVISYEGHTQYEDWLFIIKFTDKKLRKKYWKK